MKEFIPLKEFFLDPILSTATIGSMLMCLASSLVGVIAFIQKRSLIGEALSHATYPGIILSILLFLPFLSLHELVFPLLVIGGAFLSGAFGIKVLFWLEKKLRIHSDVALCFVLSTFLGVGVLLVSRLQFLAPSFHQKAQVFLYGQAATMLTSHLYLYGALGFALILFLCLFYHPLKVSYFDEVHAKVIGLQTRWMTSLTQILIVLAVVIGIRSVGVVLMAGMLIAPAACARQMVKNLGQMFFVSGAVGLLSGFLGNYFSVNLSIAIMRAQPLWKVTLPTGPMILVVATGFALLALLFAGNRGLVVRVYRKYQFQLKCVQENLLKGLYKEPSRSSLKELSLIHRLSRISLLGVCYLLSIKGLVLLKKGRCLLTEMGSKRAERIVRLHRLWEVYLFDCLGIRAERVHKSAEEMEHIITPELEKKLSTFLNHPKKDPHNQTIPEATL